MDDPIHLLLLQIEWGADEAIALDPLDRLRAVEPAPPGAAAGGQQPAAAIDAQPRTVPIARQAQLGRTGALPSGTPGERALALAGQAATLEDLRAALAGFDGCALRDTASNLVFAEGDQASSTLVIGEPPGREEDRSGRPFAGAEGQLLDQMLASLRLTRGELMLAPLLPWRPPGGRPPSAAEIAICLPFLHRLIQLQKPRRLVLFGGSAARALLQAPRRRRGARGWVEVSIPGIPASLPALTLPGLGEMLANPPLRREAWAGLRLLRHALDEAPTKM